MLVTACCMRLNYYKSSRECLHSQVKYFDQKRVYDAYKKKLEKEGYQEGANQDDT